MAATFSLFRRQFFLLLVSRLGCLFSGRSFFGGLTFSLFRRQFFLLAVRFSLTGFHGSFIRGGIRSWSGRLALCFRLYFLLVLGLVLLHLACRLSTWAAWRICRAQRFR